jgi:hypothetical protein
VELRNPFSFFDAIYCIDRGNDAGRWQAALAQFENAGIAARIRRFPFTPTPADPHIGGALAHRAVVQEASRLGLRNVLVFEDDVVLTRDAQAHLLYLGACCWNRTYPLAQGCAHLEEAGAVTALHAIAYHESIYSRILDQVPADIPSMQKWLKAHHGLDQYFANAVTEKKFLLSPLVASSAQLMPFESEDFRERVA